MRQRPLASGGKCWSSNSIRDSSITKLLKDYLNAGKHKELKHRDHDIVIFRCFKFDNTDKYSTFQLKKCRSVDAANSE